MGLFGRRTSSVLKGLKELYVLIEKKDFKIFLPNQHYFIFYNGAKKLIDVFLLYVAASLILYC